VQAAGLRQRRENAEQRVRMRVLREAHEAFRKRARLDDDRSSPTGI
jgi:hypothetical protein